MESNYLVWLCSPQTKPTDRTTTVKPGRQSVESSRRDAMNPLAVSSVMKILLFQSRTNVWLIDQKTSKRPWSSFSLLAGEKLVKDASNSMSMSSVQIFQTVAMIYVLRDIPRTMLNITSVGFNSVPILMRKIYIREKLTSLKRKSMN